MGGASFVASRLVSGFLFILELLTDPEPKKPWLSAKASRTAAGSEAPRCFRGVKSASRRRAEAALWRAAKAGGLAQSKTWRPIQQFMESLPPPNCTPDLTA
jgi:hypothetical protein